MKQCCGDLMGKIAEETGQAETQHFPCQPGHLGLCGPWSIIHYPELGSHSRVVDIFMSDDPISDQSETGGEVGNGGFGPLIEV